jgi:hypothetical protein
MGKRLMPGGRWVVGCCLPLVSSFTLYMIQLANMNDAVAVKIGLALFEAFDDGFGKGAVVPLPSFYGPFLNSLFNC